MKSDKNIREGYKRTTVGVIPEEWEVKKIDELTKYYDGTHQTPIYEEKGIPFYSVQHVTANDFSDTKFISEEVFEKESERVVMEKGDILMTRIGDVGTAKLIDWDVKASFYVSLALIKQCDDLDSKFFEQSINGALFQRVLHKKIIHVAFPKKINLGEIGKLKLPIPPLPEQQAIANCLTTWDSGIEKLTQLIAAKREQKKGLMQQLLTGKKRLDGFVGEWEEKKLGDIADCLNNVRVPLNSSQRDKMRGNIPYCGANGIVDYVNDHVIDDDIILLAEDGGYFDEFQNRPIAYRMNGKCWVNNHAHILKAKEFFDQSFLFYSLVHKNIVPYIVGGTRAKLNQSALLQIKMIVPKTIEEQNAIAHILTIADQEISLLEKKLEAMKEEKKGVMQVLLTGKKRLIDS